MIGQPLLFTGRSQASIPLFKGQGYHHAHAVVTLRIAKRVLRTENVSDHQRLRSNCRKIHTRWSKGCQLSHLDLSESVRNIPKFSGNSCTKICALGFDRPKRGGHMILKSFTSVLSTWIKLYVLVFLGANPHVLGNMTMFACVAS